MRAAAQASQHRHTTPPALPAPREPVSRLSQRNTTGAPVKTQGFRRHRKWGRLQMLTLPALRLERKPVHRLNRRVTSSLSHRALLHLDLLHRRHLGQMPHGLTSHSVRHSHLFLACLMFPLNYHPPSMTDPSKLKPGTSVGSSPAPPSRTVRLARPHARPRTRGFRAACWPPQGYTGQLCWDHAS